MKLANSSLISEARNTDKGSGLLTELLKVLFIIIISSFITDTLFVIVIEDASMIHDKNILSCIYLYWQILTIGIVILLARFSHIHNVGFKSYSPFSHYLRGTIIGLLMIVSVVLLGTLAGAFSFYGILEWSDIPLIILFAGGYIVQGMAEEILCRGYVLLSIARKNKIKSAIIGNSLFFAFMHCFNSGFSLIPLFNLFLFSVFESIYFLKTENIWGCAAIHTSWNFVQGCIFGFGVSGEDLTPSILYFSCTENSIISGGQFGPEGGLIVTLVTITCIMIYIFKNSYKP